MKHSLSFLIYMTWNYFGRFDISVHQCLIRFCFRNPLYHGFLRSSYTGVAVRWASFGFWIPMDDHYIHCPGRNTGERFFDEHVFSYKGQLISNFQ